VPLQQRYLEIIAAVDAEFARSVRLHGERIHCRRGCTDCCYHRFRITEIEAAYIRTGIERLSASARAALAHRAREYVSGVRMACPALENGVCSIYESRPLMCHKFGMPLYNPDKPDRIFACELNFKSGEEIHDPDLIHIQTGIHHQWRQLQSQYDEAGGYRDPEPLTVARAILEDFSDEAGNHRTRPSPQRRTEGTERHDYDTFGA
jgi:uncharacterized protein